MYATRDNLVEVREPAFDSDGNVISNYVAILVKESKQKAF